jgi:hypothetical protein
VFSFHLAFQAEPHEKEYIENPTVSQTSDIFDLILKKFDSIFFGFFFSVKNMNVKMDSY